MSFSNGILGQGDFNEALRHWPLLRLAKADLTLGAAIIAGHIEIMRGNLRRAIGKITKSVPITFDRDGLYNTAFKIRLN
jgi:hypothetical protein